MAQSVLEGALPAPLQVQGHLTLLIQVGARVLGVLGAPVMVLRLLLQSPHWQTCLRRQRRERWEARAA